LQYFELGDGLNFATQIKDKTGTFVTPTTIVLSLIKPDESTVIATVNAPSAVGKYDADYVPASSGEWQGRFVTTGPGEGQLRFSFYIKPSPFQPGV